MTEGPPVPGDLRPRTLARPPGERYGPAPATAGAAAAGADVRAGAARPALLRATLFGGITALGIAALFAIVVGVLDLGIGLLALAVIGGWTIGFATRAGAWPRGRGSGATPVRLLAVAFAIGAWLVGYFGAYALSLLIRPDSSLTFGERLAQTSFLDWLSPQFSALQVLEIGLIVLFALFSSRSVSSGGTGVSEA